MLLQKEREKCSSKRICNRWKNRNIRRWSKYREIRNVVHRSCTNIKSRSCNPNNTIQSNRRRWPPRRWCCSANSFTSLRRSFAILRNKKDNQDEEEKGEVEVPNLIGLTRKEAKKHWKKKDY